MSSPYDNQQQTRTSEAGVKSEVPVSENKSQDHTYEVGATENSSPGEEQQARTSEARVKEDAQPYRASKTAAAEAADAKARPTEEDEQPSRHLPLPDPPILQSTLPPMFDPPLQPTPQQSQPPHRADITATLIFHQRGPIRVAQCPCCRGKAFGDTPPCEESPRCTNCHARVIHYPQDIMSR